MGKRAKKRVVSTRRGKPVAQPSPRAADRRVLRGSVKARRASDLTQPVLEPESWDANR